VLLQLQHSHDVLHGLRHHRQLVDVRVLLEHAGVDFVEVLGRLRHVVVTDDALDRPKAANTVRDVRFQVDPLERPRDNRLADVRQSFVFGATPAAAIDGPAKRRHPGALLVGHQPFEFDRLREEVDADFKELRPAFE
jgi:hypothetical protein